MIQAFYTSANTMVNHQKKINVIAGNIANVNTAGYKRNELTFSEMLYSTYEEEFGDNRNESVGIGNGITLNGIVKDSSKGIVVKSGEELDVALEGDGFFVLGKHGDTVYSKGGSFKLSAEEDTNYIVDGDGYYLMDDNMDRVMYTKGMTIDNDGAISKPMQYEESVQEEIDGTDASAERPAEEPTLQKLMVVEFENPREMISTGNGSFRRTEGSGIPSVAENTKVMQGYTEKSNVDIAGEMTELIKTQRIYQMNSKIVQTVDEMKALANRLRK